MRSKNVKLLHLDILNRRTLLSDEDSKDLNEYRRAMRASCSLKAFNMRLDLTCNLVFIHPEQTICNLPDHPNIYTRTNLNKRLRHLLKPNRYRLHPLRRDA